jgi:hypothetical protein
LLDNLYADEKKHTHAPLFDIESVFQAELGNVDVREQRGGLAVYLPVLTCSAQKLLMQRVW